MSEEKKKEKICPFMSRKNNVIHCGDHCALYSKSHDDTECVFIKMKDTMESLSTTIFDISKILKR